MNDVAATLRCYAGNDFEHLLEALEDGKTAQGDAIWRDQLKRIRRAAGLAPRVARDEPKALLDLIDQLGDQDVRP